MTLSESDLEPTFTTDYSPKVGSCPLQPSHLPQHATFDLSIGKDFERWSVRGTAVNLFNNQFLTGFESSFAGTHYNYPREISVQVRYRFHF